MPGSSRERNCEPEAYVPRDLGDRLSGLGPLPVHAMSRALHPAANSTALQLTCIWSAVSLMSREACHAERRLSSKEASLQSLQLPNCRLPGSSPIGQPLQNCRAPVTLQAQHPCLPGCRKNAQKIGCCAAGQSSYEDPWTSIPAGRVCWRPCPKRGCAGPSLRGKSHQAALSSCASTVPAATSLRSDPAASTCSQQSAVFAKSGRCAGQLR